MEYAGGGAIAATAPNPCGTPTGNQNLYREVLNKIYLENERVLGRIVYDAKCRIISTYFPVDSLYGPAVLNNLIGDPALRLKYGGAVDVGEEKNEVAPAAKRGILPGVCRSIKVPARAAVTVWNTSGRCVVKDREFPAGAVIDLPAGVYFVRLDHRTDRGAKERGDGSFGKVVVIDRD